MKRSGRLSLTRFKLLSITRPPSISVSFGQQCRLLQLPWAQSNRAFIVDAQGRIAAEILDLSIVHWVFYTSNPCLPIRGELHDCSNELCRLPSFNYIGSSSCLSRPSSSLCSPPSSPHSPFAVHLKATQRMWNRSQLLNASLPALP